MTFLTNIIGAEIVEEHVVGNEVHAVENNKLEPQAENRT
jgi:hypothetical protein